MADSPAHTHAVVLKMQAPYAKYTDTVKVYSNKFALSGADLENEADALALATALWGEMAHFYENQVSWVGWVYYKAGQSVNSWQGSFTAGTHNGLSDAWGAATGTLAPQQLEVSVMIRALMGTNSKGRKYYLRKYLHGCPVDWTAARGAIPLPIATPGTAALTALSTGFGANDYIVVDPKNGNDPQTPWQLVPYLTTRQLRRAPKARS